MYWLLVSASFYCIVKNFIKGDIGGGGEGEKLKRTGDFYKTLFSTKQTWNEKQFAVTKYTIILRK